MKNVELQLTVVKNPYKGSWMVSCFFMFAGKNTKTKPGF